MKKTLLIFLLFLTGCTISINEQMGEVEVESEDFMQEYLEKYMSIIKETHEDYKYIDSGSISFEVTDSVFHMGVGKVTRKNAMDDLVIIGNCKNKKKGFKYCSGNANLLGNETNLFYTYNYVKEDEDYAAYYFGAIEGEVEIIKYNGNDLETTVGEVELNGEMKKYTLWFYKTDIEEQFDGELLTY